jgi:hypothetical protein
MSRVIYTNWDFQKNEIQNARVQNLASAPSSPVTGQLYYDTSTSPGKLYYYNGSAWVNTTGGVTSFTVDASSIENIGTAGDPSIRVKALGITNAMLAGSIANTKLATDPLARANHTGTQLAASVSDFDTQVRTSRLDQMAAPTADVSLNTHKLTNVTDPAAAQDAATKNYVDNFVNGLAYKDAVRAATTANGALVTAFENGDTIDGVALVTGDRILLKNQTTGAENGIYTVNASGAPTRATDADSSTDLVGAAVFVSEGTVNGNTLWLMTTDAPITVNTTALVWTQIAGVGTYTAAAPLTLTGNQFGIPSPLPVANGGTNATTAAAARTSLGAPARVSFDIGDNSAQVFVVTHALDGGRDIIAQLRRSATPWDVVEADIEMTSTTTVTVRTPSMVPTAAQFRLTLIG